MANLLIVESKNDKLFLEKLIEIMNLDHLKIDEPICIDEYECLSGLDEKKLIAALESLSNSLPKRDIKKVGIIIDQDNYRQAERLNFVDKCVDNVFNKSYTIDDITDLIDITTKDTNIHLKIGCYFTNVHQTGELETVLKSIKTQPSPYADCLETWRSCIKNNQQDISDKDFDKFWFSIYLRYDTCSAKESKQAGRKCSMSAFDYVLNTKSHILDFESSILDDLKTFLRLFTD